MSKKLDLTGQRFGRLVVIKRAENHVQPSGIVKTQWLCKCDCGNEIITQTYCLTHGDTKSCGCLKNEKVSERMTKHGCSKNDRLYRVWIKIKERCYNPNNVYYCDYGGRGITMCDGWKNDYMLFRKWAYDNGYDENAERFECTIDRIDVNGDYSPDNCRWVDMITQANNKRTNHILEHNGECHTMAEWSKITGIPYKTLCARINDYGFGVEEALTTPLKGGDTHCRSGSI